MENSEFGIRNSEEGMEHGVWGMEKTYFFKSVHKLIALRHKLYYSSPIDSVLVISILLK